MLVVMGGPEIRWGADKMGYPLMIPPGKATPTRKRLPYAIIRHMCNIQKGSKHRRFRITPNQRKSNGSVYRGLRSKCAEKLKYCADFEKMDNAIVFVSFVNRGKNCGQ